MKTLEIGYWTAIICGAGFALWLGRRKSADSQFRLGERDGKKYLDAGVFPASIRSFLEVQKSRGLSGPYEMGLQKSLKGRSSETSK